MRDNEIKIKVSVNDLASRALRNIGDSARNAGARIVSSFREGITQLRNFSLIAGGVLVAGITAAAGSMISLASDANETRNRFEAVFGDMTDTADKFAKNISESTGRSIIDIESGLASFQSYAQGLGFAEDKAVDFSTELQELSIDFASFNNLSDGEAQQRFLSALAGSPEVLQKFGVITNEAALNQKFLELGLDETTQTATEQQKVMARFSIIKEVMGRQGAIGDAVRTNDEFANALRGVTAQIKDYKARLGKDLLPILAPLTAKTRDFIQNLGTKPVIDFGKGLVNLVKGVQDLDQLSKSFSNLIPDKFLTAIIKTRNFIVDLREQIFPTKDSFIDFAKTVGILTGAIVGLSIAVGVLASPLILVLGTIAALSLAYTKNLGGLKELVDGGINYLTENLVPLIQRVKEFIINISQNESVLRFIEVMKQLILQIRDNLIVLFDRLKQLYIENKLEIDNMVKSIGGGLIVAIGLLVLGITGLVGWLIKGITWVVDATSKYLQFATVLRDRVVSAVKAVKDGISNFVNDAGNKIGSVIEKVQDLIDKFNEAKNTISGGAQGVGGGFANALNSLRDNFATGGSFRVGGKAGIDNNLVAFNASRGEQITVTNPSMGQQAPSQNKTNNLTFNISGNNPMQIAREIKNVLAQENILTKNGLNPSL